MRSSKPTSIAIVAMTPGGNTPDRAAVPAGAGGICVGAAGRTRRSGEDPDRLLPSRAHGGDRIFRARHSSAGRLPSPAAGASTTESIPSSSRQASAWHRSSRSPACACGSLLRRRSPASSRPASSHRNCTSARSSSRSCMAFSHCRAQRREESAHVLCQGDRHRPLRRCRPTRFASGPRWSSSRASRRSDLRMKRSMPPARRNRPCPSDAVKPALRPSA